MPNERHTKPPEGPQSPDEGIPQCEQAAAVKLRGWWAVSGISRGLVSVLVAIKPTAAISLEVVLCFR